MVTVAPARQWAAAGAILGLGATIVMLAVMFSRNLGWLLVALLGLALASTGAWLIITDAGIRQAVGIGLVVAGGILTLVAYYQGFTNADRGMRPGLITLVLFGLTVFLARFALRRPPPIPAVPAAERWRPEHAVLLCNPWSGGGKVEKFGLIERASELGVETVSLDHGLDLEQLARDAAARGADCLAMAGGDGSQALVASVAIEHGLPFVCIPAGTRNHFALDLGLDRDDPRGAMVAFRDAVERRVDYATMNGRLFVNNASFGVYATIVQEDEYRGAKVDVTRSKLKELLGRDAETFDLQFTTPAGHEIDGAFLVLVSNNRYVLGPRRDATQRRQIDDGVLEVIAINSSTGPHAARLLTMTALGLKRFAPHWHEFTCERFEIRSRSGSALVGVDGEALQSDTPITFAVHPQGLRMLVPDGNLEEVERRRARSLRPVDLAKVAIGREWGLPSATGETPGQPLT